jgi:hypothetical protein
MRGAAALILALALGACGDRLSAEQETCGRTADCEAPLRCVEARCVGPQQAKELVRQRKTAPTPGASRVPSTTLEDSYSTAVNPANPHLSAGGAPQAELTGPAAQPHTANPHLAPAGTPSEEPTEPAGLPAAGGEAQPTTTGLDQPAATAR